MRVDIEDIIAEGNEVATCIVWRGSHRKSGEEFHQMGILFLRLDDRGQLAERWSAYKSLQWPDIDQHVVVPLAARLTSA